MDRDYKHIVELFDYWLRCIEWIHTSTGSSVSPPFEYVIKMWRLISRIEP